jgi:hypothetical protein
LKLKVGEEAQMAEVRLEGVEVGTQKGPGSTGRHVAARGVARGERRLGVIDYQLGLLEFHSLLPSIAKELRRRRKWET